MLNKFKNKLKVYLRNKEINSLTFEDYSQYKEYFIKEDKKSQWDPSVFSKLIEKNLIDKDDLTLVEIGVARGSTADFTIKKLSDKITKYIGVDPYKSNYDKTDTFSNYNQDFMDNCYLYVNEKIKDPRFNLIRSTSKKASFEFKDGSIDAIFIDGNHSYISVLEDIKHWSGKVKPGGLIVGDDYLGFQGVRKAVTESFSEFQQEENTWFVIK